MTLQPLTWSTPATTGYASTKAVDGDTSWRIVPVPRDVTRIHYQGKDADGTLIDSMENCAYAESLEEALIVIDILRAGTDHLPGWQAQLEAAGFVRVYPEAAEGEILSVIWRDDRDSGLFSINVFDGSQKGNREGEITVDATYETDGADFWHNVSSVTDNRSEPRTYGSITMRQGLADGIDVLKAGVAAAITIRDARTARGGSFEMPLGGETQER